MRKLLFGMVALLIGGCATTSGATRVLPGVDSEAEVAQTTRDELRRDVSTNAVIASRDEQSIHERNLVRARLADEAQHAAVHHAAVVATANMADDAVFGGQPARTASAEPGRAPARSMPARFQAVANLADEGAARRSGQLTEKQKRDLGERLKAQKLGMAMSMDEPGPTIFDARSLTPSKAKLQQGIMRMQAKGDGRGAMRPAEVSPSASQVRQAIMRLQAKGDGRGAIRTADDGNANRNGQCRNNSCQGRSDRAGSDDLGR